jgi:hypothetical protein
VLPDRFPGAGPLLLMVGAPPLGPRPRHATLRSAVRAGLAERTMLVPAWPAAPAADPDYEPDGRSCALEEG